MILRGLRSIGSLSARPAGTLALTGIMIVVFLANFSSKSNPSLRASVSSGASAVRFDFGFPLYSSVLLGALKSCFFSQIFQLRPNQRSSPRLRGATGFPRFLSVSQCLRGGFCFLVAARLRCVSVVGFALSLLLSCPAALSQSTELSVRLYSLHPEHRFKLEAVTGHLNWRSCDKCQRNTADKLLIEASGQELKFAGENQAGVE